MRPEKLTVALLQDLDPGSDTTLARERALTLGRALERLAGVFLIGFGVKLAISK